MESATKPTVGVSSKSILTIIGLILVVAGIVAATYLSSRSQDVRQQAQVAPTTPPAVTCTGSNSSTTSSNSCNGDVVGTANSCQTVGGQSGSCQEFLRDGSTVICDCIAGLPSPTPAALCTVIFNVSSPTPTPSNTATPTPSPTRTPSPTPTPSNTATPTPSPTRTPSPSPTSTSTSTPTPSPTRTPSPTPTPSNTATPTPSPTRTPSPSPSAVPTATPLAICISLQMTPPNPAIGQPVTFTCGNVAGTYRYEFRIGLPGGSVITLQPISLQSNVSQPYTITQSGPHGAQCRLCSGPDAASCQPWEQQ